MTVLTVMIIHGINFDFAYGQSDSTIKGKLTTLEFSNLNDNKNLPIQYADIFHVMASKYSVLSNDKNYTVLYIFTNLDTSIYDYGGKVSSISKDLNTNSMIINLYNISQTDTMEILFNSDLIPVENGNFTILVDGVKKGYDLSTNKQDVVMSFVIPQGTHQVKLVGTNIVPEFNSLAVMIITISIIGVIVATKSRTYF